MMAFAVPRTTTYFCSSRVFTRHSSLFLSTSGSSKNLRCRDWTPSRLAHSAATTASQTPRAAFPSPAEAAAVQNEKTTGAPLSNLPFPILLRSFAITACTSSRLLLPISIRILSAVAYSKSALLSPDRNSLLRWLLKRTIYAQFCAGETPQEVRDTIEQLHMRGVKGVLLGYAREVEIRGDATETTVDLQAAEAEAAIHQWAQGTLETIKIAPEGGFVCMKFTGAGPLALHCLGKNLPPPALLEQRLHEICALAHKRHVRLCIDAEQWTFQEGIDSWTLSLQRRYNKLNNCQLEDASGKLHAWACIYNTFQAYLRSTPKRIARELDVAAREGFALGVKLVRGAYLGSEPRELVWDTKTETDTAYDSIAASLMKREYGGILVPSKRDSTMQFPEVSLVLATHNLASARKALSIRQTQAAKGHSRIDMVYAQLKGMADHVTGELVSVARAAAVLESSRTSTTSVEQPHVCKYLVWGSVGECAKYLVRRAEENRDAVSRTAEARVALGSELRRRMRIFGR